MESYASASCDSPLLGPPAAPAMLKCQKETLFVAPLTGVPSRYSVAVALVPPTPAGATRSGVVNVGDQSAGLLRVIDLRLPAVSLVVVTVHGAWLKLTAVNPLPFTGPYVPAEPALPSLLYETE